MAREALPKATPHDHEQLLSYATEVLHALGKSADWKVTNDRNKVDLAAYTTDIAAAQQALRAAVDAAGTQTGVAHGSKSARDDARHQMHDAHRALLHGAVAVLEAGGLTTQAASLADRHALAHPRATPKPADTPKQPDEPKK